MNQQQGRVPLAEALRRLSEFPHLGTVIDQRWLELQYLKPVESYSLFTGWLSTSDFDWTYTYSKYAAALDNAVAVLEDQASPTVWSKLRHKLRTQSDRRESKGALAELSLAVFLVQNSIAFDMEQKLDPTSSKDVDFRLNLPGTVPVYIEMQSLAESDASRRSSQVSAYHGGSQVSPEFVREERRIIGRIHDKTPKLVAEKITLVALDCTAIPEDAGIDLGTIPDAMSHIFGQSNSDLTEVEKTVRKLVDCVIWFQIGFGNTLQPVERGHILNEHSPFHGHPSLAGWIASWSLGKS